MMKFYVRQSSIKAYRTSLRLAMTMAIALFCGIGIAVAQDSDGCYNKNRNNGISAMNKKDYDRAIRYFEIAKKCDDKPSKNDLDAKIKECQNRKTKAAKDKKDAEEKRRRVGRRKGVAYGQKGLYANHKC